MFTPWTICLPSCSSKCICRCALRPSRTVRSRTHWKYRQKCSQTSANLYDLPAFCRCTLALFSVFRWSWNARLDAASPVWWEGQAPSLQLLARLENAVWSVLPAGSEQHKRLFSHTETRPMNLSTKMRQALDLSFVLNIPILKITCYTIKCLDCLWQEKYQFQSDYCRKLEEENQTKVEDLLRPFISVFD